MRERKRYQNEGQERKSNIYRNPIGYERGWNRKRGLLKYCRKKIFLVGGSGLVNLTSEACMWNVVEIQAVGGPGTVGTWNGVQPELETAKLALLIS